MEREKGYRENARKILEIDIGGREENAGIPSQKRNAEINDEKQSREKSMRYGKEAGGRKGKYRIAQACLIEIRDRAVKRKELSGWKRERSQFFKDRGMEVQEWEGKRGR